MGFAADVTADPAVVEEMRRKSEAKQPKTGPRAETELRLPQVEQRRGSHIRIENKRWLYFLTSL